MTASPEPPHLIRADYGDEKPFEMIVPGGLVAAIGWAERFMDSPHCRRVEVIDGQGVRFEDSKEQ